MTGKKGEVLRGRVLRTAGGIYYVQVGGQTLECALRGRLKREEGIGRVAVGDEVELEKLPGGCVIVRLLPRRTRLSRRSPDGRREQIIAANVDGLAAVFSVAEPDPVFALLDRFLVLAESNGIGAFVVVNKVDLSSEGQARRQFGDYEGIGYEVVYTSAKRGDGIAELRGRLAGRTTLFVGPSGVGKTSLLNAMQPGLGLRVGGVSRKPRRGRHTTVAASLQPLDVGGYVLDTPGLGQLCFWEVQDRGLDRCFPEFEPFLGGCRFTDCSHVHEPGCAIVEAVESGRIARSRYESYVRILEEAREGRAR
jgi:ribosome biogenesis GTPase